MTDNPWKPGTVMHSMVLHGADFVLAPIHVLLHAIPEMNPVGMENRSIHVAILHGAYANPSTLVVTINGSPPRATLFVDLYALRQEARTRAWVVSCWRGMRAIRKAESLDAVRVLAERLVEIAEARPEWREMVFQGEDRSPATAPKAHSAP